MDRTTSIAAIRLRQLEATARRLQTLAKNHKLRALAGYHPSIDAIRTISRLAEAAASMAYEMADDVGRGVDDPPLVVVRQGPHNGRR
jgi:hypothetical protein